MNKTTIPGTPTGNHCPGMTVLERRRASRNDFGPGLNSGGEFCMTGQGFMVADGMKLDPDGYSRWPDLGGYEVQVPAEGVDGESGQVGDQSLGERRKFDRLNLIKTEYDTGEKRLAESKLTAQSNNDCKTNSKNSRVQKQDYIHVRARRGQATDSHSLAERARREKISERMKFLQDLVPGCNKITGKAGMLDEIINYVQSLQTQVEFLSMKLAVVNPRLDIDIDSLYAKQITPACTPYFPSIPMPSELGMNHNPGSWRTISSPLQATGKFIESSDLPQMQAGSAAWEDMSLQNVYNVS